MFVTFIMGVQCRPELSEQCKCETDAMDASARTRVPVSDDEKLRPLGHVREEKYFLLLFTETALLCGSLL